jgi:hypothetical protein
MSSTEPLPWLSGKQDFQNQLIKDWLLAQSEIPCSVFVQPFKKMGIQAHPLMGMGNQHSFYNENLGRSKTEIQKRSINKPSPSWSLVNLQNGTAQNLNKLPPNLQPWQSYLQCVHASISNFQPQNNKEQELSDFKISASSGDPNNLNISPSTRICQLRSNHLQTIEKR